MNFNLPNEVKICLDTLKKGGVKAYLVGGCVRDMLMEKQPHDYDIAVNASPVTVKALFCRTIDTGIKHGTVTVLINGLPLEITQMRTDGEYTDHRRPNTVAPASSLEEDLARRDFTVNAMAMDRHGNITDIFGGAADLDRKIIRCVGDPNHRFDEDALRIMRAFRFCSQLEFTLDEETLNAALIKAPLLENISAERIFAELKKTLCGKNPAVIAPLFATNALKKYGICGDVDLSMLNSSYNDINVRLAALIIICDSDVISAMKRLKSDNATAKTVCALCRLYRENTLFNIDEIGLKRLIFEYGYKICLLLCKLYRAFGNPIADKAEILLETVRLQPIFISDLAIKGRDLLDMGISGKHLGKTLNSLMQKVWENPDLNERNTLIDIAKNSVL